MYSYRADIVGVCFEGGDFLAGVVVVDAELEVIAAADDPVLAGDEAAGADGDVGELEGFDDGLGFVGPDVDVAAVERGENLLGYTLISTVICTYWTVSVLTHGSVG